MRTFIIIVFISILATGCTKTNSDIEEINYICNKIAEDCAGNNSLLILKSTDIPSFKEKAKGYWVGPFYKGLLLSPNDKFISSKKIKLIYNNARLHIYLLDKTMFKNEDINLLFCEQDSVPILYDNDKDTAFITKDAFVNYTKKAKLYKLVKKQLYINNQPVTLVLPICKKDTLCLE